MFSYPFPRKHTKREKPSHFILFHYSLTHSFYFLCFMLVLFWTSNTLKHGFISLACVCFYSYWMKGKVWMWCAFFEQLTSKAFLLHYLMHFPIEEKQRGFRNNHSSLPSLFFGYLSVTILTIQSGRTFYLSALIMKQSSVFIVIYSWWCNNVLFLIICNHYYQKMIPLFW